MGHAIVAVSDPKVTKIRCTKSGGAWGMLSFSKVMDYGNGSLVSATMLNQGLCIKNLAWRLCGTKSRGGIDVRNGKRISTVQCQVHRF